MKTIVDLREERKKRNMSPLSELLQERMHAMLAARKQILLFHNRRGLATSMMCELCGDVIMCPNCDVSMTYHRKAEDQKSDIRHFLMCHYCGKTIHVPDQCPSCHSSGLKTLGFGTQQLEIELQRLFPKARMARLDKDSTAKKHSHEHILQSFAAKEIDILIGTQMITKGHDFPNVGLIGIVLADTGFSIPDFRARERTYQLLTQVAGRTGRRGEEGEVVIQTYNPEDITIDLTDELAYKTMYQEEIDDRKTFDYPPFSCIIKLTYVHPKKEKALADSKKLLGVLEKRQAEMPDDTHIITLAPALIPRLHNKYHMNILIKGHDPRKLLNPLLPLPANWRIDVDPISVA